MPTFKACLCCWYVREKLQHPNIPGVPCPISRLPLFGPVKCCRLRRAAKLRTWAQRKGTGQTCVGKSFWGWTNIWHCCYLSLSPIFPKVSHWWSAAGVPSGSSVQVEVVAAWRTCLSCSPGPYPGFLGGCAGSAEQGVAMTTPLALPEPAVCKKQPGRCLGKAQSAQLMQGRPAPSHDWMDSDYKHTTWRLFLGTCSYADTAWEKKAARFSWFLHQFYFRWHKEPAPGCTQHTVLRETIINVPAGSLTLPRGTPASVHIFCSSQSFFNLCFI